MTIKQAIHIYIESRSNVLSPSTKREYQKSLRLYFLEIGDIHISKTSNQILQKWINDLSYDRSPKTVRNIWSLLHAALRMHAPGKQFTVDFPKKRKTRINIPSEENISQLIQSCRSEDLRTAIILASCMGLRRSEICALKWSDIREDHFLIIDKAIVIDDQNRAITKQPKTISSNRILEVPEKVLQYLNYIKLLNKPKPDSYIVPLKPDGLTKRFVKLRNRYDIVCRFHDLRHYYASVLVALNIPDIYAMEMMGHSTPGMLKKVYQHIMEFKMKDSTEKVNTYFTAKLSFHNYDCMGSQVRVL